MPTKGNFAQVTKEDLWVMYMIITRQNVDLCFCIVNQMIKSFSGNNWTPPYGMVVSNILDTKEDNFGS